LTSNANGIPAISTRGSLFVARNQKAAIPRSLELDELKVVTGEVPPQYAPRRGATVRAGEDQMPPGAEDSGDLGDRWSPVDDGDEVEVVGREGDLAGAALLEGDAALGVEADSGACPAHGLGGGIDSADAGRRELAGEEERCLAVAAAELQDALGLSNVEDRGGQWGEGRDGHGLKSII
jgi:hypothetical protein